MGRVAQAGALQIRDGGRYRLFDQAHVSEAGKLQGPERGSACGFAKGRRHGHDDYGRATAEPGPIDVQAWGAAAVGVLLGLFVVLALIQALS